MPMSLSATYNRYNGITIVLVEMTKVHFQYVCVYDCGKNDTFIRGNTHTWTVFLKSMVNVNCSFHHFSLKIFVDT